MADDAHLQELVDRLLVKDRSAHEAAVQALADAGDERVAPHLLEVATIHAVATRWDEFGFPEVLREEGPPRSLSHPEVRWPGAIEALCAVATPDFDGRAAWLRWESWLTRSDVEPLAGFDDWKLRLFERFHPLVGSLLDTEPPLGSMGTVRWGNTDPSSLHPLNGPSFVGPDADYLRGDDLVFGFEVGGNAFAVPRFLLFPHELLNAELAGVPVALTYCTMCNSPILYDRRIEGQPLTFGSTGCLRDGNKLMYDEETRSLWSQHRGAAVAGPLAEDDAELGFRPVTQTEWDSWRADHPETRVLSRETGYDWEYERYRDYDGFIARHYWSNPEVTHPGVAPRESALDDQTYVYGVEYRGRVVAFPVDQVDRTGSVVTEVGDRRLVAVSRAGDVAVYEAPPTPVDRETDGRLRDADGTVWRVESDALRSEDSELPRVPGRHGLWLAFRTAYDDPTIADGGDRSG